jgi:putative adhesin
MPTFATPEPITATIEVVSGSIHLVASDRDDTVVQVNPRDPSRTSDVRTAEGARIDFCNGSLEVSVGRRFISLGRGGAVRVDIELPMRSKLHVSSVSAQVRADGGYGDCRVSTVSGDSAIELVAGNIKADSVSGDFALETLTGSAAVSTASGDVTLGELVGDVTFRAASGSLSVRHLQGGVNAQTSSGDTTVAAAANGAVSVQTASGEVQIGIPEGTAAKLDLRTHSGEVRNTLTPSDGPADGDERLTAQVRTHSGDISVQRATAGVAAS